MGSERCYVWKSVSSSSASTTSSSMSAADLMVKIELEAAEALADLAHLAVRESGGGGSGGKWGSKGKRARKRVKSESPPADSVFQLNPVDWVPCCSDLAKQDRAVLSQQQCEKINTIELLEPANANQDSRKMKVKAEQDSELAKPTTSARSYTPLGIRKSRQNLTEAEKEERRIRRVLANRESARQTIRRRQALCEELTRKAADLSWENENLKREKELALKVYQSLETTNKHLKEQMAKVVKAEVEETPGERGSADLGASLSSSTNCPRLLYDHHPFMPAFWPSIIQSSSHVQSLHGRRSAIVIQSNIPMPAACSLDTSQEQENRIDVNGPRTSLYVLPCPWFFPHPGHGNGRQPEPSTDMKDEQDETSHDNHYGVSSSTKFVAYVENHHCSLPVEVKTEASGSTEARPANDDLNETPVGLPPNGGDQNTGAHSEEILFTPALLDCFQRASTMKHENRPQLDYTRDIETPSTACCIASALPEKKQKSTVYPNRKLIDVVAAAEARKRRKELTKLKNLHVRQCRMHC
ncbi:hypothetical protein F2P56_005774 [Juglans regia]|uniref:BZIP domain-containing protein n=2 Tax=Juglans regia TaxID=51240 RepID=A0A833XYA6_JUGRE|nr:uncharacterized protein LOC108995783 isoform X1 [Juglans regia]KAF5473819.1 hypothetical protein F2P56_005774 [Juglans regia]